METSPNGTRYKDFDKWEIKLHQPYDYKRKGLLKHLLSHKIIEATQVDGKWKPSALGMLLNCIETSLVLIMRLVDRLKNFKNYAYTNR